MGRTVAQIAQRLGITERSVYRSLRRSGESYSDLVKEELKKDAIDSAMVLTRLSEMFNADIADIINPETGSYKPIHQWPAIWRKMLSGADVKELFERSKDGGGSSWDKVGELVKLKFVDPLKLLELLGQHVKVQAFQQKPEPVAVQVSAEVVNLAQVFSPEQLQEARAKLLAQNSDS